MKDPLIQIQNKIEIKNHYIVSKYSTAQDRISNEMGSPSISTFYPS